jgi:hypothetical protein
MENLFPAFTEIPLRAVGLQGAIQLILVAALLIFKVRIPRPNKCSEKRVEGCIQ